TPQSGRSLPIASRDEASSNRPSQSKRNLVTLSQLIAALEFNRNQHKCNFPECTDINFYTSSVLDHINTCIDNVTTVKHVKHFPNQKPWMNSEVRLLLKAKDAAFKSDDAEDYSRARANLKRGIRKAKHALKLRIKEHFHSNSDPRRMWKGIQTITENKPSIQSLTTSNAFLPDELNHLFARFDKGVIHHTRNADSSTVVLPISLSTTEVFPHPVRLGNHISSILILNTGVPQGCVLSPLLYSMFTHDCVLQHNSNIFINYADDTTVVSRISNSVESANREEIQSLSAWCSINNLNLNATKTKELIVDFQKSNSSRHYPIYINGSEEHVSNFKFLGIHISVDLFWHLNTSTLVRKSQQCLYFLRRLKKVHLSPKILSNFYRCIIERILTSSITVWYGSSTVCERNHCKGS
ncbi:hypothetical protein QTP86_015348, partial [Hemibagrus guttatus]